MANTGELSLKITANMAGLLGGIDKVMKGVDQFGSKVVGIAKTIATPFERTIKTLDGVASKVKSIGGIVSGVMGGLSSIPLVGGLGSAVQSFFGFFTDADSKFSKIAAAGRLADKTGLSTEFISTLQMAGLSTEELDRGMKSLGRQLAGVHIEGEDATGSLDKFGLSVDKMLDMTPEGRVLAIAEAYAKMPPGIERSAMAATSFGRNAQGWEKILKRGEGGIKSLREEADRLGISFSRVDAAKIEQGQLAIKKIGNVFEGFKTQFAIGIAPVISGIAKALGDWINSGPALKDFFRDVGEFAGKALLMVVDGISAVVDGMLELRDVGKNLKGLFKSTGQIITDASDPSDSANIRKRMKSVSETVRKAVDDIERGAARMGSAWQANLGKDGDRLRMDAAVESLDKLEAKLRGIAEKNAGITDTAKEIRSLEAAVGRIKPIPDPMAEFRSERQKAAAELGHAGEQFGFAGAGAALSAQVEQQMQGIQRVIAMEAELKEIQESPRSRVDQFGDMLSPMNARLEVSIERMKKDLGGVWDEFEKKAKEGKGAAAVLEGMKEKLNALRELNRQNERDEWFKGLREAAKSTFAEVMNPAEKLDAQLSRLGEQFAFAAIDAETYRRAVGRAFKEFDDANAPRATPKAVLAGSSEAFSIINQFQNKREAADPWKRLEERQREQVRAVEEGTRELRRLVSGLLGPAVDVLPPL